MRDLSKNIKNTIIIIISILFMFQDFMMENLRIMTYLDEVVFIFLSLFYFLKIICRKKILTYEYRNLILMSILMLIGILGNIVFKYQYNIYPIARDIYNTFKVFIIYYASYSFMESNVDKRKIIVYLAKVVRIIIFVAFICCCISFFYDIGMSKGEIRYGLKSFSFIYSHPGILALYIYLFLFILTVDLKYNINRKNRLYKEMFILLCLFVWAMTLRSRAFVYIVIYILLYYKLLRKKNNEFKFRLKWIYLIIIIIIAFPIMYDKIIYYFGENSQTARRAFLENSVIIASRCFPIGSGFATFGTDMAYKNYSDLYIELGFNNVFGLSLEFGIFASDNYWPAILAQMGIMGLIIMIAIIYNFYNHLYRLNKTIYRDINITFTLIFVTYITVLSSIATATYFHFTTMALFFMLPLLFDKEKGENN